MDKSDPVVMEMNKVLRVEEEIEIKRAKRKKIPTLLTQQGKFLVDQRIKCEIWNHSSARRNTSEQAASLI